MGSGGLDADARRRLVDAAPALREIALGLEERPAPAALVHQDMGVCNVQDAPEGFRYFDWSDVVVGPPWFSCDRSLDQVSRDQREAVIDAWLAPFEALASRRELRGALREALRLNVLHEVIRYRDELDRLEPRDPLYAALRRSVIGQLAVAAGALDRIL